MLHLARCLSFCPTSFGLTGFRYWPTRTVAKRAVFQPRIECIGMSIGMNALDAQKNLAISKDRECTGNRFYVVWPSDLLIALRCEMVLYAVS